MLVRRAFAALAVVATTTGAAGCSSLLSADPTPVPGAAATLTRSVRTPIPTPVRTPEASPGASAVPSRVAIGGSPSPVPAAVRDEDVAEVQRRLEQAVASPDLPDIEGLLLDHVSLSTAQGGSVMDSPEAAAWLRDHAAPGLKVTRFERDTQTSMLQVLSSGWPIKDPVQQGNVTFSLRRYDSSGRPDEELGQWKIDVIEAE